MRTQHRMGNVERPTMEWAKKSATKAKEECDLRHGIRKRVKARLENFAHRMQQPVVAETPDPDLDRAGKGVTQGKEEQVKRRVNIQEGQIA